MDKHRDTADEFYKDLQKGRVDQKDFERHIYGQYGAKSYNRDEIDDSRDKNYEDQKKIENEVKDYIEKQK